MASGCSYGRCTDVDQVAPACKFELGCDIIAVINTESRLRRCDALWERDSQRVTALPSYMYVIQRGYFFPLSPPPEAVEAGRREQKWTEMK